VGKLAGELEGADIIQALDDGIAGKVTWAAMVLQPLSERAKEERIKLAGAKKRKKGGLEEPLDDAQRAQRAQYFTEKHPFTSESFGRKVAATQKAAEDAAAAVTLRRDRCGCGTGFQGRGGGGEAKGASLAKKAA
jgi:hypothetical protein